MTRADRVFTRRGVERHQRRRRAHLRHWQQRGGGAGQALLLGQRHVWAGTSRGGQEGCVWWWGGGGGARTPACARWQTHHICPSPRVQNPDPPPPTSPSTPPPHLTSPPLTATDRLQLGNGEFAGVANSPVPVPRPEGSTSAWRFASISAGGQTTCGVVPDQSARPVAFCWGRVEGAGANQGVPAGWVRYDATPVLVSAGSCVFVFVCVCVRSGGSGVWEAVAGAAGPRPTYPSHTRTHALPPVCRPSGRMGWPAWRLAAAPPQAPTSLRWPAR